VVGGAARLRGTVTFEECHEVRVLDGWDPRWITSRTCTGRFVAAAGGARSGPLQLDVDRLAGRPPFAAGTSLQASVTGVDAAWAYVDGPHELSRAAPEPFLRGARPAAGPRLRRRHAPRLHA
jgi:hypothetical protein